MAEHQDIDCGGIIDVELPHKDSLLALVKIVLWVAFSLLLMGLFGWVQDLYRLATQNWDMVEHDEDIEAHKLLQLALFTGAIEVAGTACAIIAYANGHWWSTHWTFALAVVMAACFVVLVWIRRSNESEEPYFFVAESPPKDSKAIAGNLSGILFIGAVVVFALYYGVSTFFCWTLNYCS